MNVAEAARRRVLANLGLDRLVTAEYLDIEAGHRALANLQRVPATFHIDDLTLEAPAGVYHPTPESSTMLFIHNIQALAAPDFPRMLEIGTGCGAIALFVAHRWGGYVVATDISETTLASAEANARRNGLAPRLIHSDLFASVGEGDFDLVVFNTPLIDKAPEDDLERQSLCDPGGRLLRGYLDGLAGALAPNGVALFGICCNTAYQRLEEVELDFEIVGLELIGKGFWRAIVAARRVMSPA
ncbi:MAG: class I SAM-dependent methyltransferase [Pseudomonadota bacterium]|nr:class I SAM-dependent methyltransferase [Pseudomonadota bacterium]